MVTYVAACITLTLQIEGGRPIPLGWPQNMNLVEEAGRDSLSRLILCAPYHYDGPRTGMNI